MGTHFLLTGKNRYSWLLVGWIMFSLAWIRLGGNGCLTNYYANYNVVENYSVMLSQHSRLYDPIVALVVAFIVGIVLVRRAKRWRLSLLLVPLVPFACLMLIGNLFCDQTILRQIDTVEFDGRVYHLTLGDDIASGLDVYSQLLLLHECDQYGENCRGREIARSYMMGDFFVAPKLEVDETLNQLRVVTATEELFTRDAYTIPITVPQNRQIIRLENLNEMQEFSRFRYDRVTDIAWSHDGTFLAASGYDALWLHEFRNSTVITRSIPVIGTNRFGWGITNVAVDPKRHLLAATGALNGAVQLWNIGNEVERINFPDGYDDAVAFSPDGKLIATSRDSQLTVLDAATFTELAVLMDTGWHDTINDLEFSRDGVLLAASGFDHNDEDGRNFVRVWNMQSDKEIFFFRGPDDYNLSPLAIAPDSNHLAFATREKLNSDTYPEENEVRLHVWNLQENTEQYSVVLPSDVYQINDLIWTPDGKAIITSDSRNSIQFWNAATGELIEPLIGKTGVVNLLAISPDGTILATGDIDGTIRLWTVLSDD